jgi:uncharacterized protein YdcH (DUF465 family)
MVYAERQQVINVSPTERRVFLETRLRNLKRKHAKLSQHADLLEEYEEIDKEIQSIENELNLMN